MSQFIQTVLQISISMAALIGLLLLLMPVWQQRYSARWRKVIWLMIAIRLLVPFSIELPSVPVQVDMDLQRVLAVRSYPVYVDDVPAMPEQATAPSDLAVNTNSSVTPSDVTIQTGIIWNQGMVLFAVWLTGAIAFALWHGVQYMMFRRKVNASVQPLADGEVLLHRAGAALNLNRYPPVAVSSMVQGPMLIGFTKPVILLPERIYDETETLLILRHELTHYKHYDLWYKLVLLLANAVHWFNPLVWLMNRQAGRDVEQVCDDAVVAGRDMAYRKAYSMTILNTMASQRGIALSTYLSKDAQKTKKRFAGILQPKQYKKGVILFAMIMLLAVVTSGCLQIGKVAKVDAEPLSFWEYSGFLDEYPGAVLGDEQFAVMWQADYDGDGRPERVHRALDEAQEYCQYQIEFANGDVLKVGNLIDNLAVPHVNGVDLTGDGQNEIIFQVDYPTSTNPLGVGELAVFERNDGAYQLMGMPFETEEDSYVQKFPVTYSKADGQAVEVSVAGTDFKQVIPIADDLWNGYQYKEIFANGETMESTVWAYKIQQQDGRDQMVCSVQLFDKWSEWGLDIMLAYKNGRLVIDEIHLCEDIYAAWF